MLVSMTGYGKGIYESDGKSVCVELKSVNHRFLDLAIKIPRAYNALEDSVRNTIKSMLNRGRVDVYISITEVEDRPLSIRVNNGAIKTYLDSANEIANTYNIENDIKVSDLFKMKDVFIDADQEEDLDKISNTINTALNIAIENLIKMRKVEGEKIKANIIKKLDTMKNSVMAIEEYAPKQVEQFREKLRERVEECLNEVPIDEAKLLNEVIFYADKVAVDEEFTRLYAHIEHFKEIMESDTAVGRSLDFIVQEMNREANTIGSKCSDLSVANHVLTLKTEIEKLREQIQNIE